MRCGGISSTPPWPTPATSAICSTSCTSRTSSTVVGSLFGRSGRRRATLLEEKIEAYFLMNRFLHESFEERSSIFSLRELLGRSSIEPRTSGHSGSAVIRDLAGRPPTSHFHVVTALDSLLATLELNFFLTKYYVMSDRDGRKVTVFALNYGLCDKQTIQFGRPSGKREYRLYYVERIFDYTAILQDYLRTNQEIVCDKCGHRFEYEQLPALQMFDLLCPKCRTGTCQV